MTYPRDLAIVGGEIELAESDLARSKDRLEWAKRMFEKKYVSKAQKVSEELNLEKAQFALEQAKSKLKGADQVHQGGRPSRSWISEVGEGQSPTNWPRRRPGIRRSPKK